LKTRLPIKEIIKILFLCLVSIVAQSQTSSYDSLTASDTLNWTQMQYLDSLIQSGARWQEHTGKLVQLGVVKQIQEKAEQIPEHIQKLDSLLQEKSSLIKDKIRDLSSNLKDKTDSASQNLPFDLQQYTSRMESIDQTIDQYSSQLTNREERSWLQDHLSQLQQMDGTLNQYPSFSRLQRDSVTGGHSLWRRIAGKRGKLLDIDELKELQGYKQQLQELTGQSQGYFQEALGLRNGLNKETLLSEEGGLMQRLQSLIGNRQEFQELQAKTAELEQFKQLSQKYGEDYARNQRQEAQQKLLAKAKEIGAGAFEQYQDKVQQVQEQAQKLKKKYSSVADARDLSTAVKRNSLKGEPLAKRLVLGGTFQITPSFSRKDSLKGLPKDYSASVDLSPVIGYRLNKKFTAGASVTYRANIIADELETHNQTYGWRGFLEYFPKESIFFHGEYQAISTEVTASDANIEEPSRQWINGALVGVGKEFALFKGIKGQVMILYDFLFDGYSSPYQRPLAIRFGIVM